MTRSVVFWIVLAGMCLAQATLKTPADVETFCRQSAGMAVLTAPGRSMLRVAREGDQVLFQVEGEQEVMPLPLPQGRYVLLFELPFGAVPVIDSGEACRQFIQDPQRKLAALVSTAVDYPACLLEKTGSGLTLVERARESVRSESVGSDEVFARAQAIGCRVNLKALGQALEFYSSDQNAAAPDLAHLVPKYLKQLPTCPMDHRAYAYAVNGADCTATCPNHHGAWSSQQGLVPDGRRE